jgi:hypothetical protein
MELLLEFEVEPLPVVGLAATPVSVTIVEIPTVVA